jgi:hypothetical protein
MENVIIFMETGALKEFEALKDGEDLFISQLSVRYYNELFRFPPDRWGRVRRELGKDTFVSDRHCPFEIRGWIEDTQPKRTLHVLQFSLRKRHTI